MGPENSCFITVPATTHRCPNPVNTRIADHILCLYDARCNGKKCGVCSVDDESLEFCTTCPSILCHTHRQVPHERYGKDHVFVNLNLTNEEILKSALNRRGNNNNNRKLEERIDDIQMNKESIDISLVRLENSMNQIHNKRRKLIEEAENSFEEIKLHIEKMKEHLIEDLNSKSDIYLRELDEKSKILKFKSSVASRALALTRLIYDSGLKVTDKFVNMLSNNSLASARHMFEIPPVPMEHTNLPKILTKVQDLLEDVHPVNHNCPTDCITKYFFPKSGQKYCISRDITYDEQIGEDELFVKFTHFPNFDGSGSYYADYVCPPSHPPKDIPTFLIVRQINECPKTMSISLAALRTYGCDIKKIHITACTGIHNMPKKYVINFLNPPTSLSVFSVTPGYLTSLAKLDDKLFAISKNGKEILRLDSSPELITQQIHREVPLNLKIEHSFGLNHFAEPKGIAVLSGLVFVSDCSHHAVFFFTDDGSYLHKSGHKGAKNGQFKRPMGLAGDQEGDRIIVADSGNRRIQILLLATQDWISFDVEEKIDDIDFPIDVKLDTFGSFFILTNSRAILKYSKHFKYICSVLHSGTISSIMPFFAIDTHDVIYLCSENNGSVYMIKPTCDEKYNLNKIKGLPNDIRPVGMTVDEEGRLYLTHNKMIASNEQVPTSTRIYVVTQHD
ncbi:Tripartite motif-containing protein 2-like [Oopsacas minuta]|uniref:Tripartite motif-containing protein 2-like n=1 Tax=Oopsacas minuta TaxID=111878 RepID=A0AAV7K7B4_9METZ|nr:Tripartite motif-containing protein 2-like [Oopsacas minuta]